MKKKNSWTSRKSNVYHNNSDCNTGNNIEKENHVIGTCNKRLCKECKKLQK